MRSWIEILAAVLAFLNQDKLSLFVHCIPVHDSNINLYAYYLHIYNMFESIIVFECTLVLSTEHPTPSV